MSDPLDLALCVLDRELVDVEGRRCGRVDDIELEGAPGAPLEAVALLVGPDAWAARLGGGRLGRLLARLAGGGCVRVDWSQIETITHVVRLRGTAGELGLASGDRRLGKWLARRLPG